MRKLNDDRRNLFYIIGKSKLGNELKEISDILHDDVEILHDVHNDVKSKNNTGRNGLSAEQILRIAIIKQYKDLTYEELEFHLSDSSTIRSFAMLLPGQLPKKSTLQENINRISESTWIKIIQFTVKIAEKNKVDKFDVIRFDATAVETNIHTPRDSSLIEDGIRVITRLLTKGHELFPIPEYTFSNHNKAAKKKSRSIGDKKKKKEYRGLIRVAQKNIHYAQNAIPILQNYESSDFINVSIAHNIAKELEINVDLLIKVVDQTERRIFKNEIVPADQKVLSFFETHTDIIKKEKRDTTFGHKIFITTGKSGIVTDCIIVRGNPNDATMCENILQRQSEILGKTPRQAAADGGFASKNNLEMAKNKGVEDMSFSKKRGLKILDMVKSEWVYKKLRNFRAGIEGIISALKRAFGLDRCNWKGWEGFKKYVLSRIVAFNFQVLARA